MRWKWKFDEQTCSFWVATEKLTALEGKGYVSQQNN